MKHLQLSVVLSVQQAGFNAVAFKGNLAGNLAKIAGWGYDGVELAIRDRQCSMWALVDLVASYGLAVPALGTGQAWGEEGLSYSDPDPVVRRSAIERTKAHIPLARRLDATNHHRPAARPGPARGEPGTSDGLDGGPLSG